MVPIASFEARLDRKKLVGTKDAIGARSNQTLRHDDTTVTEQSPHLRASFRSLPIWPQVVLIGFLFLASLTTLFWNAFSAVMRLVCRASFKPIRPFSARLGALVANDDRFGWKASASPGEPDDERLVLNVEGRHTDLDFAIS